MTTRRRLAALTLVMVVIAVALVAPGTLATTRSDPRLSSAQRDAVASEARLFFDNPVERLLQIGYAVTGDVSGGEPQCPWVVEAFTLFGIPAGRVVIACDGSAQRL